MTKHRDQPVLFLVNKPQAQFDSDSIQLNLCKRLLHINQMGDLLVAVHQNLDHNQDLITKFIINHFAGVPAFICECFAKEFCIECRRIEGHIETKPWIKDLVHQSSQTDLLSAAESSPSVNQAIVQPIKQPPIDQSTQSDISYLTDSMAHDEDMLLAVEPCSSVNQPLAQPITIDQSTQSDVSHLFDSMAHNLVIKVPDYQHDTSVCRLLDYYDWIVFSPLPIVEMGQVVLIEPQPLLKLLCPGLESCQVFGVPGLGDCIAWSAWLGKEQQIVWLKDQCKCKGGCSLSNDDPKIIYIGLDEPQLVS